MNDSSIGCYKRLHDIFILGMLGISLAFDTTVTAQSTENSDLYELDIFTIDAEENTGYSTKKTLSGIGVATDMMDMPTVTSVVSREFLDDNLGGDFNEAMDYSTSVRQTSRSQITARRSFFTIRGFETSQILVNSVRANEDGIIRFNKPEFTMTYESWPVYGKFKGNGTYEQHPGFPKTVKISAYQR